MRRADKEPRLLNDDFCKAETIEQEEADTDTDTQTQTQEERLTSQAV